MVSQPTFLNPVAGTIYPLGSSHPAGSFVVTSPFGPRTSPFTGFHDGIDIANGRCGDPVYSSAAGVILNSGTDIDGAVFGIIQHPDGWRTYYWHLTAEWLTNGYSIGAGVQLGTIGSTGNSTACHLHFTIKRLVNGVYVAVDPWPLLAQNGGGDTVSTVAMEAFSPARQASFVQGTYQGYDPATLAPKASVGIGPGGSSALCSGQGVVSPAPAWAPGGAVWLIQNGALAGCLVAKAGITVPAPPPVVVPPPSGGLTEAQVDAKIKAATDPLAVQITALDARLDNASKALA